VLLRINLEPATPEEKKLHQHLQTLLDAAVVQQAENSVSRRRGSRVQAPERSVHRVSPRTSEQRDHAESGHSPVKHRLGPNCNALDMVSAGARAMMAANAKRAGSTTGGMESATIAARTGRARRPTQGIRGPSLRTCSPSFPGSLSGPNHGCQVRRQDQLERVARGLPLACHNRRARDDLFIIRASHCTSRTRRKPSSSTSLEGGSIAGRSSETPS
jgi:hypothetical protein